MDVFDAPSRGTRSHGALWVQWKSAGSALSNMGSIVLMRKFQVMPAESTEDFG
jgi:hypothetical protein